MSNYNCKYCMRQYKTKYHYDRHTTICKFMSKTPNELEEDIEITRDKLPTNLEMYQLIKHLSYRIDKLEKENLELKRIQERKINMIQWLNAPTTEKPIITFENWLIDILIPKIPTILEDIYKTDLINGIDKLLEYYLSNNSQLVPICSFKTSKIIYIFDKNNDDVIRWKQLSIKELNNYIEFICNQVVSSFNNEWFIPNQNNVTYRDNYKEQYLSYSKKILASNLSKETRLLQIRMIILKHIVRPHPSILVK